MSTIQENIRSRLDAPAFRESILEFLTALCAVDTTPSPDIARMRRQEARAFELIESFLAEAPVPPGAAFATERRPIDIGMAGHPAFSKLHFTKTPERPRGLSAEETYAGRANLLAFLDGTADVGGRNTALNAHVDVIAPFFPPRREGDRLYGRGTIDDKGNVAVICAALRLLMELAADGDIELKNKITAMFPVEEETGGNGSLALALDGELRQRYASLLVMECADAGIYPGNRGAVWFKCDLRAARSSSPPTGKRQSPAAARLCQGPRGTQPSLLYAAAEGILAMAEEGARIKAESDHPLFPHRPVQTCNGVLGPFGEHPSRINDYVNVRLAPSRSPILPCREPEIRRIIDGGLAAYIAIRGDKTKAVAPAAGRPKVERHYDLTEHSDSTFTLEVHGSTGHMGSILENDDAILKWAFLARALDVSEIAFDMTIDEADQTGELVVEGGQGFLPTHPIEEIQERMRHACLCGVRNYLARHGFAESAVDLLVSYDKLHNNAFAGDPESPTMRNARRAGIAAGILAADAPVRGWDVSCDARLFATEHPELPVITSGVGRLSAAHANDEHLKLPDLWPMIEFIARFLLLETGSQAGCRPPGVRD